MSTNSSSNNISDLDLGIPDPYEYLGREHSAMDIVLVCVLPLIISVGLSLNILGVVVIFRARLWSQLGSRIHLTALLMANVCTILVYDVPLWINMADNYSLYVKAASRVMCRLWPFVQLVVITALHWILVALLAEVCWHDLGGAGPLQRRFRLPGSPPRRAKVVLGAVYVVAILMNLWYPSHPDLIHFDEETKECGYNFHWVQENVFRQIAWRFFVEYLPLWLLAPGLSILLAYRRCGVRAGVPATRLFNNSDDGEDDDGDGPSELAAVSFGAAVFMLASILPISIYEIGHLFSHSGHSYTSVGALQIVCETHLVSVPAVCLAISASMRRFVRNEVLNKCPRVRLTPAGRADDRLIILDSIVATEEGDNNTGTNS